MLYDLEVVVAKGFNSSRNYFQKNWFFPPFQSVRRLFVSRIISFVQLRFLEENRNVEVLHEFSSSILKVKWLDRIKLLFEYKMRFSIFFHFLNRVKSLPGLFFEVRYGSSCRRSIWSDTQNCEHIKKNTVYQF